MTKIRKFFGIGRKPIIKVQKKQVELPENFIVGSTNQKASGKGLLKSDVPSISDERSKSDVGSKSDARNDRNNKKVLR